ncbi:MAG: protein TolQ [Xanthomonadales bacterium]|nr:protein TolQ [Gammaproteobacteria bacterium]MBT8051586.1 protein TolQ [Gammaproteobacteria bacterium]MBT8057602.1 protein TolQ [Gammaproteobacteria bacterium]NNJ78963.1 protein TolQ [Xanthomonadales bacterium]NNL05143.1 protein TolQ [Xanthomonadales bacterium]
MQNELQILDLVMQASWLVKGVMLLLLMASIASWIIIFRKRQVLNRAEKEADLFEEKFWSGTDLNALHESITTGHRKTDGMERIFESGFSEFLRMRQQGRMGPSAMVEGAQRAMRIALTRETEDLELRLSFLATVGSTSPYIGLFGTVWGIMTSFHQLANVNQATIAMVAPGISEALIATAMGLFAAIPAVIGYNRFSNQVERLDVRYDNFKEEFSSILQRQAHLLTEE